MTPRPPRVRPPAAALPTLRLAPVPASPAAHDQGLLLTLLPSLGGLAMLGMALGSGRLTWVVISGAVALLGIGTSAGSWCARRRAARRSWQELRERYRGHVSDLQRRHEAALAGWLDQRHRDLPDPEGVLDLCRSGALWERRPSDDDAGVVALGAALVAAPVTIQLAEADPLAEPDPDLALLAGAASEQSREVEAPVALQVLDHRVVCVVGPAEAREGVARAMAVSLMGLHHPAELAVHVPAPWGGPATQPAPRTVTIGSVGPDTSVLLLASVDDCPDGTGALVLIGEGGQAELVLCASGERVPGISADQASVDQWRELLDLLPPTVAPEPLSLPVPTRGRGPVLRAVLGESSAGRLAVDLAEPASGGDGPHALLVGATGSGKSETLRTWVAALLAANEPDQLHVLLVDFKGGHAFAPLAGAPHVAGVLTNLSDDPAATARFVAGLRRELRRRQQLLAERSCDDIAGLARGELARLVVVVDEAAELLGADEGVADALRSALRLGRSLGVHVVLSSQRLDGRLAQLADQLRLRMCLHTGDPRDVEQVVGGPVSALTRGVGRLAVGVDGAVRGGQVRRLCDEPALLEAAVRPGPAAARLWCPPLPDELRASELRATAGPPVGSGARLAIGLVDDVAACMQPPLVVDLGGTTNHVAVVGPPRSGRSMALRALVEAACSSAPAAELELLVVGRSVVRPGEVPHLRAVAEPTDLSEVQLVLDELVERLGADRSEPRTLLCVDDVGLLLRHHPAAIEALTAIAAQGPGRGVHLALAGQRWADVPSALLELVDARVHLGAAARPGLGRLDDGRAVRIALPSFDRVVRSGAAARPLRVLPACVEAPAHPPPSAFALGVTGADHRTHCIDLRDSLVVIGGPGSGRTALLRRVLSSAGERETWVVDPRGSLAADLPAGARAATAPHAVDQLVAELRDRLLVDLGGSLEAGESRRPTPRLLVVDDEHLVAPDGMSPLSALAPLVSRARDLDLRIALSRSAASTTRAAFDPMAAALRELAPVTLVLPADPLLGAVAGRVAPQPGPPGRAQLVRPGQEPLRLQLFAPAQAGPHGASGSPSSSAALSAHSVDRYSTGSLR